MTIIMRGGPVAAGLYRDMEKLVEGHPGLHERRPRLATLAAGEAAAARSYRTSIERACTRAGVEHVAVDLPAETPAEAFTRTIAALNDDPTVSGILVFLPLPDQIPRQVLLENLSPFKDVDGITPESQGRLRLDLPGLRPSCPLGGMEILDFYGVELSARDAIVVGRSPVVGGPLATMLTHRDATVTVAHRKTLDLARRCRASSLIALAAGSPGLLTGRMVSPDAVVLDFGTNIVDGKIMGDADRLALDGYVAAISPVPGGTGPVTAAVLVRNVLFAAIAVDAGTLDVLPRAGTSRPIAAVAD